MKLPFDFPLPKDVIAKKRALIHAEIAAYDPAFRRAPVKVLEKKTLALMLECYDRHFFGGYLRGSYESLRVTLSSRLLRAAGKFIYSKNPAKRLAEAEIRMSSDFLSRLAQGPFTLNGLTAATAQEAFLIVFEHELCHAAETALYGSTGHSKRFLALANGLFGHTGTTHSLPTRMQDAQKSGLCLGTVVAFPYQGQILKGRITYIGKTVTVMVQSASGDYRDRFGRRYTKYSVPIELLKRIR